MHINSEIKAQEAIDKWQSEPPRAQLRFIKEAIDSLEMSCMYYDQKGNKKGTSRCEKCLDILKARAAEVEKNLTS